MKEKMMMMTTFIIRHDLLIVKKKKTFMFDLLRGVSICLLAVDGTEKLASKFGTPGSSRFNKVISFEFDGMTTSVGLL